MSKLWDRLSNVLDETERDYEWRGERIDELSAELGNALEELREKNQIIADLMERLAKLGDE